MDEGAIYYYPPIREFKDTGFVTHGFGDKSTITAKVVPTNDSGGFGINLIVKDGDGETVCDFTMDRFAALCVMDCLNKNLLNQEELIYNEYNNKNQLTVNRLQKPRGANTEGSTMGP